MASLMRPAEYEETKIEICDASFLKNNNDCRGRIPLRATMSCVSRLSTSFLTL
jgi:hypothetical protein